MAWAPVQEVHDFSFSASAKVLVFPSNVTAGDLLIVWYANAGGSAPSIADTLGNTWTAFVGTQTGTFGYGKLAAWWTVSGSSGANTATISDTSSTFHISQGVEFSNGAGTIALDANPTAAVGSGTSLSQSVLANLANDLVIGIGVPTGGTTTMTPGAGYTSWSGSGGYNAVYQFASGAATYTPTITQNTSGGWGIVTASFKAGAAPAPVSLPTVCIME